MGLTDRGVRGARQEAAEAVFSRLVARELKRGSRLPSGENRSSSDEREIAGPASLEALLCVQNGVICTPHLLLVPFGVRNAGICSRGLLFCADGEQIGVSCSREGPGRPMEGLVVQ